MAHEAVAGTTRYFDIQCSAGVGSDAGAGVLATGVESGAPADTKFGDRRVFAPLFGRSRRWNTKSAAP